MDLEDLWNMYYDGEFYKDGLGARVVFISPEKNTFRYSFTLNFALLITLLSFKNFY